MLLVTVFLATVLISMCSFVDLEMQLSLWMAGWSHWWTNLRCEEILFKTLLCDWSHLQAMSWMFYIDRWPAVSSWLAPIWFSWVIHFHFHFYYHYHFRFLLRRLLLSTFISWFDILLCHSLSLSSTFIHFHSCTWFDIHHVMSCNLVSLWLTYYKATSLTLFHFLFYIMYNLISHH